MLSKFSIYLSCKSNDSQTTYLHYIQLNFPQAQTVNQNKMRPVNNGTECSLNIYPIIITCICFFCISIKPYKVGNGKLAPFTRDLKNLMKAIFLNETITFFQCWWIYCICWSCKVLLSAIMGRNSGDETLRFWLLLIIYITLTWLSQ